MKEIAIRADGRMVAGRFLLTSTGLQIKGKPSIEEFEECGKVLARMERWIQWLIGDWANAIPKRDGDHKQAVKDLCKICGLDTKTVRNAAWICKKVKTSRRRDVLSFQHHEFVATLGPKDQSRWLAAAVKNDWTVAKFRDEIKRWQRLKAIEDAGDLSDEILLVGGDFRERMLALDDNSVHLIFTDPPYDDDSAPMVTDLAILASQKLVEGGSLLTYCGQNWMPLMMQSDIDDYLKFWWPICIALQGPHARLHGKGVFVMWKPILWFVRGSRANNKEYVSDAFESKSPAKQHHDWEQSSSEAKYYIEKLTRPGDLVVDPFLGAGTTAIAAAENKCRFWGCEIDVDTKKIAEGRISKWIRENSDENRG